MADAELPTKSDDARVQALVMAAVGLVTTGVATYFAAFLSVIACTGSGPISLNSLRGELCDVPSLGPWPYVIGVGFVAYVSVLVLVLRRPGSGALRQLALLVLVPGVAVLTVSAWVGQGLALRL